MEPKAKKKFAWKDELDGLGGLLLLALIALTAYGSWKGLVWITAKFLNAVQAAR